MWFLIESVCFLKYLKKLLKNEGKYCYFNSKCDFQCNFNLTKKEKKNL